MRIKSNQQKNKLTMCINEWEVCISLGENCSISLKKRKRKISFGSELAPICMNRWELVISIRLVDDISSWAPERMNVASEIRPPILSGCVSENGKWWGCDWLADQFDQYVCMYVYDMWHLTEVESDILYQAKLVGSKVIFKQTLTRYFIWHICSTSHEAKLSHQSNT